MFETFLDLPVHILVIHAIVVGVPLAALITVVVALVPGLRAKLAWPVVLLNALMLGATYVARESGKWFFDTFEQVPPATVDHRELGLTLIWYVLALLGASLLVALLARASTALVAVVAVVALVVAGAATWQTVRVGHSGSNAVWKGNFNNS